MKGGLYYLQSSVSNNNPTSVSYDNPLINRFLSSTGNYTSGNSKFTASSNSYTKFIILDISFRFIYGVKLARKHSELQKYNVTDCSFLSQLLGLFYI